jgi:2-C-methyl-D-erythritol 4-phosphate cytidylyltransferase
MNIAIIAAAGTGSRMASDRPKQFLQLAGTPVIFHTLKPFELCDKRGLRKLARVVPGGTTRADSVKRGLQAIRAVTAEIVAVHDGVRPFVTVEEIDDTIAAAQRDGAAILTTPATDTIKFVEGDTVVETLPRRNLRQALTPQCFRYELLRRAYEQIDVADPSLTDESVLVERLGHKVTIVEGSARNIKITTPRDLLLAEALLQEE